MTAPVEEMIEVDDGARLWGVTEGAGVPVVLCHGGPGDTDNLGPAGSDTSAQMPRPAAATSSIVITLSATRSPTQRWRWSREQKRLAPS